MTKNPEGMLPQHYITHTSNCYATLYSTLRYYALLPYVLPEILSLGIRLYDERLDFYWDYQSRHYSVPDPKIDD